jgi:hypothetical protein
MVRTFSIILGLFLLCSHSSFSQSRKEREQKEKEKKADEQKALQEFKQADEGTITETIKTLGAPADDLSKRAVYWVQLESDDYKKSSPATSGNKAECTISYPVKQDDLNPECDYTGKITMKVRIECSKNQYTYTIYNIRHTSDSGKTTGGDVGKEEPECGTFVMPAFTWRYIRNGALSMARSISSDIKEGMMKSSSELDNKQD